MQEFSPSSGKNNRTISLSNPEFKSHVAEMVARAYYNIHGVNIAAADAQWTNTIVTACMQLCLEDRASDLNSRDLIQLFQNVIRISEEHLRESKRHSAMAANVFYLKETALDSTLYEQVQAASYQRAITTVMVGNLLAREGRIASTPQETGDAA